MSVSEGPRAVNGSASMRLSSLAAAGGAPFMVEDPMSKVLGLDAKTSTLRAWFGFTSGGTLLMVGLMALASVLAWVHTMQEREAAAATPGEIEVMKEDPPPPPPSPVEPEPKQEVAPPPRVMPREAPPPPPAPAQAARVLTQEPDPNEPVDLTGNTIVTGNAADFPGGLTASNGTGASAVRSLAGPAGTGSGGAAPAPPPPGPDRSRPASLGGGSEWNAPFPPEADTAQIDEAYVTLQMDMRPDGSVADVRVLSDPGNGFGREARRYALTKHGQPALDHDGNPIAGTFKVRVHFSR